MNILNSSICAPILPPDGFRMVPDNPFFCVNKQGQVWSYKLQRLVAISKQSTGYRTVAQATPDGVKTFYVHRLVASAFHTVPEEVLKVTDHPEVNHKDGNKDNNDKDNLEWTTPKKNIRHSIDNGLTAHEKVEARNTKTGKILNFSTSTDLAKHFKISFKRLRRHLESDKAGLLTKDWWVFRYQSDEPWPEIPEERLIENRWDQCHGLWFVKHLESGTIGFAATLQKLSEVSRIPYNTLQSVVRGTGERYTLQGHEFWYDDYPEALYMAKSTYRREHKFAEVKKVKIRDDNSGKVTIFPSMKCLSRFLGIHSGTLEYNIKHWNRYKHYSIKLID